MKVTLIQKKQETDDVVSFILKPDAPIEWQPGQYMHYRLPHANMDDRHDTRWFTISAAPFEGHLMITTRFTPETGSSFKKILKRLEIGATFEADGPEGDFTLSDTAQKYVFIAGGIGITPFRSILLQLNNEGQNFAIDLFYANKNEHFVFDSELQALLPQQPEFHIYKFMDPKRITPEDIKMQISDYLGRIFYISGPENMVKHYRDELVNAGIMSDKIKIDDFPGYD